MYEVVLVFNVSGSNLLEIAEPSGVIAMINVLSTDPGHQDQLMDVWRKGAERYWEQMPGAVGAALHRSEDGMRLQKEEWHPHIHASLRGSATPQ